MRTTPSDAVVHRLTTPQAERRIALLSVWRDLWPLFPGLARFDLGDDPEAEIRRHVAALRRRHERDISADVAEWLRASDAGRARERRHLRLAIPRLRALRKASAAIVRILGEIPNPPPPAAAAPLPGPVPFFDIVNQVLLQAEMRRAA